jgi:hypothetical protein
VTGIWHELGKAGPFIRTVDRTKGVPAAVYIFGKGDRGRSKLHEVYAMGQDDVSVEVTGVLHFQEPVSGETPADPRAAASQPVSADYYFDVEEATFRFLTK